MKLRLKIIIYICFLISILWILFLFELQMFDPHNLVVLRQQRYDKQKEFEIANRGNIYDSKGTLLVSSIKLFQIDIHLKTLAEIASANKVSVNVYYDIIANIISKHTHITYNRVYNLLSNTRGDSVLISEIINENQLASIREELSKNRLPVMVSSFSSMRRIYTKGDLAARLLGQAKGVTDGQTPHTKNTFRLEGTTGIEGAFNNDLLADYGWTKAFFDANSRRLLTPNVATKPATHGSSLYLTIDSDIQEILENNLKRGINLYQAKNAIGVIMNPNNGNIIAMSGISEEDKRHTENEIRSFSNMPIQFIFEPGSTIKPFVSLMALERNLMSETDLIDCRTWRPPYGRGNRVIRDFHEFGTLSFRDVIVLSSNVGIAKIADKIGAENLHDGYVNFGFGRITTVDLKEESRGKFTNLSEWTNYSLHSRSFGQEMQVTALQLATAYSALANGGYVLKPNIIDKKIDSDGNEYFRSERRVVNKVSNAEAIEQNNCFLLDAVERGSATNTRFQNIKIAGKTGTSEKSVDGSLAHYQRTASFVGFFPFENPEYVMVIVYDEPAFRYRFGSQSAVPTFRKIVEEMLTLPDCNIIPDIKMSNHTFVTMPNLVGVKIEEAKKMLEKCGIDFNAYNEATDSFVVQQFPQAGVQIASKNKISIYCHPTKTIDSVNPIIDDVTMPNFVGMSLRQAINLSKVLKINLTIEGSGHIVSQSIKPGNQIRFPQNLLVVAR